MTKLCWAVPVGRPCGFHSSLPRNNSHSRLLLKCDGRNITSFVISVVDKIILIAYPEINANPFGNCRMTVAGQQGIHWTERCFHKWTKHLMSLDCLTLISPIVPKSCSWGSLWILLTLSDAHSWYILFTLQEQQSHETGCKREIRQPCWIGKTTNDALIGSGTRFRQTPI